jgi:hypothetical protein
MSIWTLEMINEIFQSLHESIKKRNTPDSFLPKPIEAKDVIHRGYIKDATFPLKYDFVPDGKGHENSGTHVYSFKDGKRSGVIEINHKHRPNLSGHETVSTISFEMNDGEKLDDIQIHRMIMPALSHHMRSHGPDIIKFGDNVPFVDTLIRKLGSDFESFVTKGNKMVKRKIDPKVGRIISNIRKRLNNKKEM